MTAKHRKGKSNHKQEENFLKSELLETEVRPAVNNSTPLLVLVLIVVIGGVTGAWICFQQHQTLTYLTDNLMGIQMKIAKLQSSHEELQLTNTQQHIPDNVETRLSALEESYTLAKKQVGAALSTAEQLKTSNLPAQVLSLHTEMKARLAEMEKATVSLEQLNKLQSTLNGKSEEFEDVRVQMEGLTTLSSELSQKVETIAVNLAEVESKLDKKVGEIATLSFTLDEQATKVLRLKHQLDIYRAQLEANLLEMAAVRELLENEQSQQLQKAHGDETLYALVDKNKPAAEPSEQREEEEAAVTEEEKVVDTSEEEDDAAAKEEAVGTEQEPAIETSEDEEATAAAESEDEEAAAVTQEEESEAKAAIEEEEAAAAVTEDEEDEDVAA
ncbi:translation initiation factor IF-2, partial [Nematolebias whitei]|uniref:translation initiation factor IF-2 n=1 Tax=Nematolebias whitei TaxID=451745 RepID=UPI00189B3166